MVVWAAFSAGVIATLVQFSIPPILPLIKDQYGSTYTDSALLMSLFALATLLSAVPGGFVVQQHGVREIGLFGIGIMFIGVLTCLLANSYSMILLGRIIEGNRFWTRFCCCSFCDWSICCPKDDEYCYGNLVYMDPFGALIEVFIRTKACINIQNRCFLDPSHDCDCDMFLFLCYGNSKTDNSKVKRWISFLRNDVS